MTDEHTKMWNEAKKLLALNEEIKTKIKELRAEQKENDACLESLIELGASGQISIDAVMKPDSVLHPPPKKRSALSNSD